MDHALIRVKWQVLLMLVIISDPLVLITRFHQRQRSDEKILVIRNFSPS